MTADKADLSTTICPTTTRTPYYSKERLVSGVNLVEPYEKSEECVQLKLKLDVIAD